MEDGESSFLRNVGEFLPGYIASHLHILRRENLRS